MSVALALDAAHRARARGFGFLVPRDLGLELLGALFMSRLFAGRAPAGSELVTAMIGGAALARRASMRPTTCSLARMHAGLDRALGLRETPRALAITRWPRAVPQPGPRPLGRGARDPRAPRALPAARARGRLLDGVALGELLASGARAAARLG